MYRYKIVCSDANIREAYEFEDWKSESEVKKIWLNDVSEQWGRMVAMQVASDVEVTELTDGADTPANKQTHIHDGKTRLPGRDGWDEE